MSGEPGPSVPALAGQVPQDTTPNIADYEANCPEFVTPGGQAGCGDYRPLGGPLCTSLATCTNTPAT